MLRSHTNITVKLQYKLFYTLFLFGAYKYTYLQLIKHLFQNRDPNNPDALFPGILGGWREDIQGRERRDSKQLKRDIFVTTNYGQVQGFKVLIKKEMKKNFNH